MNELFLLSLCFSALYGSLFNENSEAAFANYRMWESVGMIIPLAYSSFLCMTVKIGILMAFLVISMVCYGAVERIGWRTKKDKMEEEEYGLNAIAELMRRKASVFVPRRSIYDAAEIMRRNTMALVLGSQSGSVRRRFGAPDQQHKVAEARRNTIGACESGLSRRGDDVIDIKLKSEEKNNSIDNVNQNG